MIAARLADALGDGGALVMARADDAVDILIEKTRAAAADGRESVLLAIGEDVATMRRAMLRAAIASLAVDCAPACRINALDIAAGASVDAIVAAATFLAAAHSTTGQVVELNP